MTPLDRILLPVSVAILLSCLWTSTHACAVDQVASAADLEFFEKEVRPLLAEHCYSCHSVKAKKIQAGLLVDSRDALLQGGDSGESIVPGDPDSSLLIDAVRYETYEMPPKGKLADKDIQTLERWVSLGAPWPKEDAPESAAMLPEFDLRQRAQDHWAWQPIAEPAVPKVSDQGWPKSDIDRFVLTRLEAANLQPARDADPSALIRRIYFDLVGLPPTPEQTAAFLSDPSPEGIDRLLDSLLDSPHFGEHWGRHWLDLVRYAESRGHEFDDDTRNAFQYRDYIIRALNADVPYDQLIREHLAGDLLSEPRLHPQNGFNESVLGTGFWFLGEWVHSPVDIRKDEADRFDNMIDVMSKAFLGVTVACARCHDHKFDAISTADYYSLSGFLQSSDYRQVRFESLEHNGRIAAELAKLDARYRNRIADMLADHDVKLPEIDRAISDQSSSLPVNYESIEPSEYRQDGFIFGSQPRAAGEAYLQVIDNTPKIRFATSGAATSDPFWNGLQSISEKVMGSRNRLAKLPRSGRTLRTPTFKLTEGKVSCRVSGQGHVVACVDSHRMIAGPLHGGTIQAIKPKTEWVELNLSRYIGHRLHLEFTPAENEQLSVLYVAQGATPEIRKSLLEREQAIAASVEKFSQTAAGILEKSATELAQSWAKQRSALQAQVMHRSRLAMAMVDGTGEDDRVLIRGNSSTPGDVEPRHFLTAVAGNEPMPIESGSGRLELAEAINDPENPLTSRVIVNRIWHYLLGRGIVPTTDDFGVLGQLPSHPELLDHLATRFLRNGRSIKHTIRDIVQSRTYQMSSHSNPSAVESDPKNMLWHHRPPKRLEGESIRDSLLALAGNLNRDQFGEPVPIHLTAFMDGRGRPNRSGPLDGDGRRSIYISVRRNFLSPFMLTFDTPAPSGTMGRRNVSNVPAQALILLNDPLVVQQARDWAARAMAEHTSSEAAVDWMYRAAFARAPTEQELSIAVAYLDADSNAKETEANKLDRWSDLAHALINTKEFVFLR